MPAAAGLKIRRSFALVVLAGCGSSASEPLLSDGGVTATGAAACEQTAPLYCKRLFECNRTGGEDLYGTLESCVIADAADCRHLARVPDVSAKFIESWAACNRALGARTCDQWKFGGPSEACRVPAGSRQTGQACDRGSQCTTNHCQYEVDPMTGSSASECGVCAKALGVGEACSRVNDCDYGLRCVEMPGSATIIEVCLRPVPEGGACDESSSRPCQGRLVCVQGRCARPLAPGAACTRNEQCEGERRCVNGSCADPAGAGAACKPEEDVCAPGLRCLNEVCTTLLPGGVRCTVSDQCLSENCLGTGMCGPGGEPAVRVGEPCAPDRSSTGMGPECVYNSFCDPGTSRCVLRKPNGQPCADDTHCLGWLRCNAGTCDDGVIPMCGG